MRNAIENIIIITVRVAKFVLGPWTQYCKIHTRYRAMFINRLGVLEVLAETVSLQNPIDKVDNVQGKAGLFSAKYW